MELLRGLTREGGGESKRGGGGGGGGGGLERLQNPHISEDSMHILYC